jgi:hypothetical protein
VEPEIRISFDQEPPIFQAGQSVRGRVTFETIEPLPVKQVVLSVLWHTMGKGTEDSGVIHFETPLQDTSLTISSPIPFKVALPQLPLSFDGHLIKIHWVVRVRVYPQRDTSFGAEARFQLVYQPSESQIW